MDSESTQIYKTTFVEMINLKYKRFKEMIEELNMIAQYFIDEDGSILTFSILKGTDATFLWKFTVRIECSKYKVDDTDIKSYRLLRLSQFINVYNHIKQQSETLKMFGAGSGGSGGSCAASAANIGGLTESIIDNYANDQPRLCDSIYLNNNQDCVKDDELCCICIERKPNLILNCAHVYCETCIKEWQVTSNTCPICRCKSGENDGFLITDKPDFFQLQDEMSKSLFEIAKQPTKSHHNRTQTYEDTSTNDDSD